MAQQKLDALGFWNKHGLDAIQDAYKVSRSALYRWRKSYTEGGLSGLHDRSRASRRQRQWHGMAGLCCVLCCVPRLRRLRTDFPNPNQNNKTSCG